MRDYISTEGYDFEDATPRIIGVCIEVHKHLGPGFREVLYQRALALEFGAAGLEFGREVKVPVYYKGKEIGTQRVDFIVEGCMLEVKAKSTLADEDYMQTLSYLKTSGFEVGLLVNFGGKKVNIRRLVHRDREDAKNTKNPKNC